MNQDKDKYQLIVEGTDLQRVMNTRGLCADRCFRSLQLDRHVNIIPGVNGVRTSSNHILEIEKTLGIEAARFANSLSNISLSAIRFMQVDHHGRGELCDGQVRSRDRQPAFDAASRPDDFQGIFLIAF